jgi:Na+/melibiose symporter-like transporter
VRLNRAGIRYAQSAGMMELLGRLGAAIGISLVLTLLLLVLYQDDSSAQIQPESAAITQTATVR